MANAMRIVCSPLFGGSTPLLLFRSRLNSTGENYEHRRPCGDVLAQRFGIDLVERVVGRVVEVEIISAVLAQGDRRNAGLDHRPDVRAVGLVGLAGHDAERREPGLERPGVALPAFPALGLDAPHPIAATPA